MSNDILKPKLEAKLDVQNKLHEMEAQVAQSQTMLEKLLRTNPLLDGWETTDERFVAFLDIMGFKDLVARHSHEDVLEKLKNLSFLTTLSQRGDLSKGKIYATIFSDSIIVFSKDGSYDAADAFIWTLRHFICRTIELKMGIKGGIAFGKLTVDPAHQLYFGQPLIDAYFLEEELQYYGAVLHHTAEEKIFTLELPPKSPFMCNFTLMSTPLRQGRVKHINLNWFSLAENVKDQHGFDAIKYLNAIKFTVSGASRRYIDNTMEAIAEMGKKYNPDGVNEMIESYGTQV